MTILAHLKNYLDHNNVKYTTITHSKAYTAQELAQTMHVPGRELAKSVVVKIDGKPALAVLPAHLHVEFTKMKQTLGANDIEKVNEREFESYFPSCELGAMPPFGNLFDMPVFVSRELRDDEEIVFNAGTHTDAIRMLYSDFERLVQPVVCEFSISPGKTRAASASSDTENS
jgi:Ala-tRNA(Pro) deacylase